MKITTSTLTTFLPLLTALPIIGMALAAGILFYLYLGSYLEGIVYGSLLSLCLSVVGINIWVLINLKRL